MSKPQPTPTADSAKPFTSEQLTQLTEQSQQLTLLHKKTQLSAAAKQVLLLTKLPKAAGNAPTLDSGVVSLFKDITWTSQRLDLNINEFTPNERQSLQTYMFNQASYLAFNLPVGTVMTMTDYVRPILPGRTVANLVDCGRAIDLVGTGQTETVDLREVDMNDTISCFFWRTVDLNIGAIELFEKIDFTGNRSTLFLSEWSSGKPYSIAAWYLQDKISSVRWKTLQDRQTAVLYDNWDGTGEGYSNIKGWGTKEVSDLRNFSFNDRTSAFRWDGIIPVKEIIAPFNVTASTASSTSGLTAVTSGVNDSPLPQPVTVSLNESNAQTVTTTSTDTFVVGVSTSFSVAASEGVKDVASSTQTFSVSANFSYTKTETVSRTETKTVALNISQTTNAPPNTNFKATLLVSLGQIPATVYKTTAQRWYKVRVTGSELDPSTEGWYKRVEDVQLSMAGTLASTVQLNMVSTPIVR